MSPTDLYIPRQATVALYYVLIEALNNVQKHAGATAVSISLAYQDAHLFLTVADDGKYADTTFWSLSALVRAGHFGLAGMYEWASLAGGNLHLVGSRVGGQW